MLSFFRKKRGLVSSLSDNDTYPQFCVDAVNDYSVFGSFRSNKIYNDILEHVSKTQGALYLKEIEKTNFSVDAIDDFRKNDLYGSPVCFEYERWGVFSPTTLRYIKVLSDLIYFFGDVDGFKIGEIGIGYGGQCRIIDSFCSAESYMLIDIQPALALAQRYLDHYPLNTQLRYKTMNELGHISCDLVISNYAFTELPRAVQKVYIDKIIKNSARGYITYNQIVPDYFNSYKVEALLDIIPGSKVWDEKPLTCENNCIITWGHVV